MTRDILAIHPNIGPVQADGAWELRYEDGEVAAFVLWGGTLVERNPKALASVLAAAPEMVEALRRLVNLAEHPLFSPPKTWAKPLRDARSLLARIEGER